MRLWTLHPRHLDAAGLVALWREALLAQRVLAGGTRGYRHHPQLLRFQQCEAPVAAIGVYLAGIQAEATSRGYRFDATRIVSQDFLGQIEETVGQMLFERAHLERKLALRAPKALRLLSASKSPDAHPLFRIVPGHVRDWEKGQR